MNLNLLFKKPRRPAAESRRGDSAHLPESDVPIRAELLSSERLLQQGHALAAQHATTARPIRVPSLLARVRANGRRLSAAYGALANAVRADQTITPAAEWFIDNFHLVEDQVREILEDLPPGYYRELPKLANGPLAGYPRVFAIAWDYVAHTDSRFDPATLLDVVRAYQRVHVLTLGELWALAISLRVVLLENLRRYADQIAERRAAREAADCLADQGLQSSSSCDEFVRPYQGLRLHTAFCVQLVMRLRGQDPDCTPLLRWLHDRLGEQGSTAEELVQLEHQRQGATNLMVRNVITSMRAISSFDWATLLEKVSHVEAVLLRHDVYGLMDFASRDRYRRVVEQLARASGRAEVDVADRALLLCAQAGARRDDADGLRERRAHLGYWLLAEGRPTLERDLGLRPAAWPDGGRRVAAYLIVVAITSLVLLGAACIAAVHAGMNPLSLIILAILGLIPASEIAIALAHRLITLWWPPAFMPRLELEAGIPATARTMVVVPTLLVDRTQVERDVHGLEILHLANSGGAVHFALLSDWGDAASESTAQDEALVAAGAAAIAALNARHGPVPGGGTRFFLLHRRRLYNERQGVWMGWERKRGKLHEVNRLLRGAQDTTFVTARPSDLPPNVRYVVTLDVDTRLPHDAVRRMVGALAHPLQHARFDPRTGALVAGHAVLQPKVTPALGGEHRGSFYQRLNSANAGLDPYAFAVSDVYQDLFGEGSYVGKGVYDVDAFERALAGQLPENTVLSHDLLEGVLARAGLDTGAEVFEDPASHVLVASARQHRWVRGDWQLWPWLVDPRQRAHGQRQALPLSWLSRWKMLDNLRRSLSAPTLLALLVAIAVLPGVAAGPWLRLGAAAITLPAVLPVLNGVLPRRRRLSMRAHARALLEDVWFALAHVLLAITLLAHNAVVAVDAIVRTLVRVLITKRDLLQWSTAAHAASSARFTLSSFYRGMRGSLAAVALLAVAVLPNANPSVLPLLVVLVVLWAAAPLVAWLVSRPPRRAAPRALSPGNARALRLVARRTWNFFATFVDASHHDLPPDNFQETPLPVVAARTSPTNLGLYLLSVSAARDFGWIGSREAVERLERTLTAMQRLERYRGHFLNWYDTATTRPLEPRYVSAVDSGNLAGHLLALEQACRDMSDGSVARTRIATGIDDALALVGEALAGFADERANSTATRAQVVAVSERIIALLRSLAGLGSAAGSAVGDAGDGIGPVLAALSREARELSDIAHAIRRDRGAAHDAMSLELAAAADAVVVCIASHRRDVDLRDDDLARRLFVLAQTCAELRTAMDFTFLFDRQRKLFAIGGHVEEGTLDAGCYDLLASEARLTSFLAVASRQVPVQHWFRLGRSLTPTRNGPALISWSGSMFEYLMPALVMRSPAGSLLERTYHAIVRRHIAYGRRRGVPWGVSESAYHKRDLEQTYQYSNFGVPGLGLKRGLFEDVVIAPYATALAAMVDPAAAATNFVALEREGGRGAYGYYDALDYTAERLPDGTRVGVVRNYMAHHQGMTIVALANVLLDGVMRSRFHAHPLVQAAELLLHERTPRDVALAQPRAEDVEAATHVRELVPPVVRRVATPHTHLPRAHVLSNGRYTVMVTAAGSGFSRFRDLAVTRWREDATRDADGSHVFIRDVRSGAVWSAGWQPAGVDPDSYDVAFSEDRVEITRRDGALATTTEIVISSEDDAEVRRVSIRNLGTQARVIEVTSYAEIVLAPPAADLAHPAFSNLFVHTEAKPGWGALFASRRPRAHGEVPVWAGHVIAVQGEVVGDVQWETDRARFVGRTRTLRDAAALRGTRPLSGTVGAVLDPVFCLRRSVRIEPGATARVVFTTLVAASREQALTLADKARDPSSYERAATMAWTQGQAQLHHLGIETDEAHLFQRVANRLLYLDRTLRGPGEVLKRNAVGARALWGLAVSGDVPLVVLWVDDLEDQGLVRQSLRAWRYWRFKRLAVDLVIVNERATSYVQDLQALLEGLVRTTQSALRQPHDHALGSVLVVRGDLLAPEQRDALLTFARVVLVGRRGPLADQILRPGRDDYPPPSMRARPRGPEPRVSSTPRELEFNNGIGGFAHDGREYVIALGDGQSTPAPWINVVADDGFGFQVSESGSGYTWAVNSRENKLTPWSNDPVSDPPGEVIYLRDEDSGEVWTPTALPVRLPGATYVTAHGSGYSRFEVEAHGIAATLTLFLLPGAPTKVSRLALENRSGRARTLSVTAYVEWVLGVHRSTTAPFVVSTWDVTHGALLARNGSNGEFGERVAFVAMSPRASEWTADRVEFIGRNGGLEQPAAMLRAGALAQQAAAGGDPCAALRRRVSLAVGARAEVVILLGEADSASAALQLCARGRDADLAAALQQTTARWQKLFDRVQVRTPDRAFDLLVGRWLLYQTVSCRLHARSAFYQSGGAFGFRDQLQDVLALAALQPALAREHILRCAARQFVEGDVQHWWHPPSGRGVRSRCSDDLVWLPYVVQRFVEVTDDASILDQVVPFLEGPLLADGDQEAYFEPTVSAHAATLFEHCARALDRSLTSGPHRLPLIGNGDWNDGMNRLGVGGRGESVWLAWFLHTTLWEFAKLASQRGELRRAETWRLHVSVLKAAVEAEAWDGGWYRRAYDDAGAPVGSAQSAECQIDAIAQSWGVISGAAEPTRAERAMAAVGARLIDEEMRLVRLFAPPFTTSTADVGYVQSYPPGIRENGGQYTHAAVWTLIANAALGHGDRAMHIFRLLNPILHADTRAGVQRYRVEPYVMAGDVYAEEPHRGRGGWTWYTGAAGWMHRAAVEWILGLRVRAGRLHVDPCIPAAWSTYGMRFLHGDTVFDITVDNPEAVSRGVVSLSVDGHALHPDAGVLLADDGGVHVVTVRLGI